MLHELFFITIFIANKLTKLDTFFTAFSKVRETFLVIHVDRAKCLQRWINLKEVFSSREIDWLPITASKINANLYVWKVQSSNYLCSKVRVCRLRSPHCSCLQTVIGDFFATRKPSKSSNQDLDFLIYL